MTPEQQVNVPENHLTPEQESMVQKLVEHTNVPPQWIYEKFGEKYHVEGVSDILKVITERILLGRDDQKKLYDKRYRTLIIKSFPEIFDDRIKKAARIPLADSILGYMDIQGNIANYKSRIGSHQKDISQNINFLTTVSESTSADLSFQRRQELIDFHSERIASSKKLLEEIPTHIAKQRKKLVGFLSFEVKKDPGALRLFQRVEEHFGNVK